VHMAALQAHGATPAHRSSFAPVREAIAARANTPHATAHVSTHTTTKAAV